MVYFQSSRLLFYLHLHHALLYLVKSCKCFCWSMAWKPTTFFAVAKWWWFSPTTDYKHIFHIHMYIVRVLKKQVKKKTEQKTHITWSKGLKYLNNHYTILFECVFLYYLPFYMPLCSLCCSNNDGMKWVM